jgi:archaellum component FlaC
MSKLDESTEKLNRLSENIGRLLATQDVSKTTNNEFREEMKILHSRIGDLQDKMNMMVDKTEARIDSDIVVLYDKVNTLEKWRWIIIGVTTVIAWALTHLLPKILDN